ncbi:hypothetical protein [Nocardioides sp. LML1-1-1.1]|uniref:hypothetical protein n=1 Tax=Nocardioides sp. LML1-1-1.1 TaxID=3135248 RepID=UPI003431C3B1
MKNLLKKIAVTGASVGLLTLGGVAMAPHADAADSGWRYGGTITGSGGTYVVMVNGNNYVKVWIAPA